MLMSDPYKLAVRVAALPLCYENNHAAHSGPLRVGYQVSDKKSA
jgi:hypothetical protein